jgi:uncharacterized protein (DUF1697 family)
MPRYIAFLRGVSPMNAKMPELKACFEAAGFTDVRTLLSSGNVAFSSRALTEATLARRAELAMQDGLGKAFGTFIRSKAQLHALLAADPYAAFDIDPGAKRVVTFLREAVPPGILLPPARDGARVLKAVGREVYSVYVPGPKDPVFMSLLERQFGPDITTRTQETVRKCAGA